tara:strand:- start:708 stop:1568 length:861 start_codon:yes stop_codon:yes gene_type:complete
MTVINVTKMWSKTGGQGSSLKYDSFATQFSLTEGYQVLAEIGDTTPVIAAASGIPEYGSQHPSGVDAYVKIKDVTQISPIFWQVIISYEGQTFDATVDVEWTDSTSSEPIDRDYGGAAILTANLEAVDGLSMDISDAVVVIRRKFFMIDPFATAAYRHATNSDTFLGWPPGTARLVGYSAKNQFKFGAPLEQWDVTARIQFRMPLAGAQPFQAWYKRWRHEGLLVRNNIGLPPVSIIRRATDNLGQEVTKPVLLNAAGYQETDPDAAVFFYTQVYAQLPYSGLGLV